MGICTWLFGIACAGLLVSCAASIPPAELSDARQSYQHASVGRAAQLVPAELLKAREALAVAEKAFLDDPASFRTRDLAYVADRKARLAEALASTAARNAETARAHTDYQASLTEIAQNTEKNLTRRTGTVNIKENSLQQYPAGEPIPVVLAQQRARPDPPKSRPGDIKSARILLIDDASARRNSIQAILKSPDYQVVVAADSENAIVLLGTEMFDAILLDNTLPDKSGSRVLEWLKQNRLDTRVIMITEAPGFESAVKSATLAARGYNALP